ncbi:hypothetical protein HMP09_0944 [Sphingomonas sp. HMP9]|uniref:hypothetical protein n=1 Tax=Sphingomonas sp. HMP9 TaxID=1517554 RepID=UPI001596E009|nr:hypothetical protein [Sphingomonas sp. HMP9]BCA61710.1 hypothetical protein HMP09_0944 [Sphingomonas sp. HMP9]
MADTDTPDTEAKKPITRRRAPRKTSAPKAAPAATSSTKPVASKSVPAAKPLSDKPVAAATLKPAAKPTPKPRSTKRATPRPVPARKATAPVVAAKPPEKTRGRWGAAAIFSTVAVASAAVGALLTLRGSTPRAPLKPKGKHAHQADGTDSSKSFDAGIADPGTVPE